ncbi:tyrosine-type recombinase/integrase [Actinomadura gamaensis]|uniref:Tyrosine-type recombinase/integrase n=1 Tax=Actinomadura gamaensis TaxID=1763541 RepID=A0ABV9TWI6_9ACTN
MTIPTPTAGQPDPRPGPLSGSAREADDVEVGGRDDEQAVLEPTAMLRPGQPTTAPPPHASAAAVLRRAARAAGVDPTKLTSHVIRATAVTALRTAGVPWEQIQDLVGHAVAATTKRYDRSDVDLDDHTAHRLSDLLT